MLTHTALYDRSYHAFLTAAAASACKSQACCPRAGEELTISYGDKGNEELLLLYGFAQPQNPHETLMVLCPLPSLDEWDEVFAARMELLQVCVCITIPIQKELLSKKAAPCSKNSSTCLLAVQPGQPADTHDMKAGPHKPGMSL